MQVSKHHGPSAVTSGKKSVNRWKVVDGLQSRSGRFGEEKNLLPRPGFEFRIVQPVGGFKFGN